MIFHFHMRQFLFKISFPYASILIWDFILICVDFDYNWYVVCFFSLRSHVWLEWLRFMIFHFYMLIWDFISICVDLDLWDFVKIFIYIFLFGFLFPYALIWIWDFASICDWFRFHLLIRKKKRNNYIEIVEGKFDKNL